MNSLITDRTQKDVDEAKSIREAKIKNFQPLTENQINTLERGMVTINTLNRIERKQDELKLLLNKLGYRVSINNKINWSENDVFNEEDFKRILENETILKKAFLVYSSTPNTPGVAYHFSTFNDIEKILYDIEKMAEFIQLNYKECGDCECGE